MTRSMAPRITNLPGLVIEGVAVHIGSQLTNLAPLEQAFAKVGELDSRASVEGTPVRVADLGGGLGVPYNAPSFRLRPVHGDLATWSGASRETGMFG